MTLELFLMGLMIVSILAGLATQGVKNFLKDLEISYSANVIAGCCAVAISAAVSAAYMILVDTAFNAKMAVWLIALMVLSWLGAMNGYDKVIQTVKQIAALIKKI